MDLFFIGLLVVASILGVAIIIERGISLRWRKVVPFPVQIAVEKFSGEADLQRLRQVCQENPSPLSTLLVLAADHQDWTKTENSEALQSRARHEIVQMERGLVILEIIVGIAPLLGLVGTIYGLILLFGSMGSAGPADNTRLANGIAVALNATLMGLMTAIPSLIAWSYYNKKIETLSVELERLCEEFLRNVYRKKTPKD